MSVLPITLYGDRILKKKTAVIKEVEVDTIELIKNMFDTMKNANGIGLAANQVGADKQIFVIDISSVEGYEDTKPMIFINPKIVESSEDKIVMEEGCLSVPDLRLEIERPKKIKIKYQNIDLKEEELEADEILARVIQHEYDHLQGILFTDYITPQELKKLKKNLEKIRKRKIEVDYPVFQEES